MTGEGAPAWRRRLVLALEAGLPLLVVAAGLVRWLGWAEAGPGLPCWAREVDGYLWGPDAGEWAGAARIVADGAFLALDGNRMPAWPLLVAGGLRVQPDVVLAGHLVNHLLFLLLPLVVYAAGRAAGSRTVGLLAAALVLLDRPLRDASYTFSADPAVAFFAAGAVAIATLARRTPWIGPLAGAAAGVAAWTHYTLVPFPLAAATVLLAAGRGWRDRLLALAGFLAGLALVAWGAAQLFPFHGPRNLLQVAAEGVRMGSTRSSQAPLQLVGAVISSAGQGLDRAVQQTVAALLPRGWPWTLGLVLPWIGVLGPYLRREATPAGGRLGAFLRRSDPLLGLALLACLAPLPLLAAGGAAERYTVNFLPVAALLFARGVAGVGFSVDALLRAAWRRWPPGVLAVALAALAVAGTWTRVDYQVGPVGAMPEVARDDRAVGRLLASHFPPGGGAVGPLREAAAYAGLRYCPGTPAPLSPDEAAFRQWLGAVARECPGSGPVPWVVVEPGARAGLHPARIALDAWVTARWPALGEVAGQVFAVTVLAIPREDLQAVAAGQDPLTAPSAAPPADPPPPGPNTGPIRP